MVKRIENLQAHNSTPNDTESQPESSRNPPSNNLTKVQIPKAIRNAFKSAKKIFLLLTVAFTGTVLIQFLYAKVPKAIYSSCRGNYIMGGDYDAWTPAYIFVALAIIAVIEFMITFLPMTALLRHFGGPWHFRYGSAMDLFQVVFFFSAIWGIKIAVFYLSNTYGIESSVIPFVSRECTSPINFFVYLIPDRIEYYPSILYCAAWIWFFRWYYIDSNW